MPQFGDEIKVKDGKRTTRTVIDRYGRVYLNFEPGNQFYVDSATGSSANDGKTWDKALNTIANGLLKAQANNSDVIWVAPGHTETIASATSLAINKAGVSIIGLGFGAMRPTLTYSATASNIPISAASVHLENILCVAGIDSIVAGITVSAADVSLKNIEWRDVEDKEAILAILTTAAANRLTIDGFYHNGFTTGDACTAAIRMVGVDTGLIQNCRFLGNYTTAIVEFHTTACTKIYMDDNLFCETGTTNYSKNVVDTITGSTWYCRGFDLAAGKLFGGGSGSALTTEDSAAVASDVTDIKTMTDKIGTVTNTAGTATIGAILGDFANSSLVTRVGAIKTEVDKIGTVVNSGGTATLGGLLGDFANSSLVTRLGAIVNQIKGSAINKDAVNYLAVTADMTEATWNTIATHKLFNVTGVVRMRIMVQCTTTVVTDDTAGNIKLGIHGATDAFIASSAADSILANTVWCDNTPGDVQGNFSSLVLDKVVNGKNVGYEITDKVGATGILVFHCWFEALSSNGAVTAGDGSTME